MDMPLPELGEGVLEAEFVDWLVAPGQEVKVGDPIAEVLTDKAAITLPSPFTGRVIELFSTAGKMISVGEAVLRYELAGAESGSTEQVEAAPRETVKQEVSAPATPTSTAKAVNGAARSTADATRIANGNGNGNGSHASSTARPKAAPAVRRRARELNIDLTQVQGTGPHGRILMEDLTSAKAAPPVSNPVPAVAAPKSTAAPELKPGGVIPMRGVRKKIAEHMVRSKTEIPHYSFMDECDVTELVRIRKQLKPSFAEDGVKLTYLAFIVKAVAEALKEFPLINSSLSESGEEILLHDHYHVGVAVATANGLVVPVIRDADQQSLKDTARAIEQLSGAARDGSITREQLTGSTFVVTSIGGIGGLISTPIINQPNVGIMGVGRVVRRPMFDDEGNVYPADLMYLSYSFDHRVVDGAIGAEFNNSVIRRLSNPAAWLIPV